LELVTRCRQGVDLAAAWKYQNPSDPRRRRGCATRKGVKMKALKQMAFILTLFLVAPTGRCAAGVARVLSDRESPESRNPRITCRRA
jgi:hypothetical protein